MTAQKKFAQHLDFARSNVKMLVKMGENVVERENVGVKMVTKVWCIIFVYILLTFGSHLLIFA